MLKMQSAIRFPFCERLIFVPNSQLNYTLTLRAPEAPYWLAGIVYASVWATMFASHLQSQDCAGTQEFSERKHWTDS